MRDYYLLFGDTAEYSSGNAANAQIGTSVTQLFDKNICQRKVATAELNVCRLDGSYDWYDGNNQGLGIWSECAGSNGYANNALTITITFKSSVFFDGAWAVWGDTQPQVANMFLYDSQGQTLGNLDLADALNSHFYSELHNTTFSDVKSIKINNIKSKPYQRFKLSELFVGEEVVVIGSDEIANATVNASYSPICNELPIDTLDAQLVSDNLGFSAISKSYRVERMENNTVRPYIIDGTSTYALGRYSTGDLTTTAGSEIAINAESDMGELSEKSCDPVTMYCLPNLWYKSNNTQYGVDYRRNSAFWQVLKQIGAPDCISLTSDTDFSINTTFTGRVTTSNCRDLMQSLLCGCGATSYMMRNGTRLLESTTYALQSATKHTLDHTLDTFSYDVTAKVGALKYNGRATGSMFAWLQSYTSNEDNSPVEYQAIESAAVKYDVSFDDDFLPCMITVAAEGSAVSTHRFACATGFRPDTVEKTDTTNKFNIVAEDIGPGRMTITVNQSGGVLPTTGSLPAMITVFGLKRFETECDSSYTFDLGNGSYKQAEIDIPNFAADANAFTKSWQAYAEYTAAVQFSTEKNVWIGETATIPAVCGNRTPPNTFGVKNIDVHITSVNIDLCSGVTQVEGVSKE